MTEKSCDTLKEENEALSRKYRFVQWFMVTVINKPKGFIHLQQPCRYRASSLDPLDDAEIRHALLITLKEVGLVEENADDDYVILVDFITAYEHEDADDEVPIPYQWVRLPQMSQLYSGGGPTAEDLLRGIR